MEVVDLPGAAHLVLADGVVQLDPASAVFEAMLVGWTRQQRARFLNEDGTVKPRLALVRRFAEFTGEYPWRWRAEDVEAFMDWLRGRRTRFSMSTGRNYQTACGCSTQRAGSRRSVRGIVRARSRHSEMRRS